MAIIALYLAQKCERFGESQSQHSDNFWQRNNRNYWEINLFFGKVLSPLQVWDKPKKDCHTKLKYKIIKLNIWPETIFAILIPILAKTILLPLRYILPNLFQHHCDFYLWSRVFTLRTAIYLVLNSAIPY